MRETIYLNEDMVIRKGVDALVRELGPVEAIRFINIPRKYRIDGVKRHREWQRRLDKDSFFKDIFGE